MPVLRSLASVPPVAGRFVKARDIVLDDDFRDLVPQPSVDQEAALLESFGRDGSMEPLIVWKRQGRLILLIGYRLYPLLQRQGLPCHIVEKTFPDRGAARRFIIDHMLARRVLTPLALAYFRGSRYEDNKPGHGGIRRGDKYRASLGMRLSAEALAEIYHVDRATILRDGQFAQAVDRLAEVGGPGTRPLLLSTAARVTRHGIMKLVERPKEEQLAALRHLEEKRRLPGRDRSEMPRTITLPREAEAFVAELRRRVSGAEFQAILKAMMGTRESAKGERLP